MVSIRWLLVVLAFAPQAFGAVTSTVVDLETRPGVTQRFLHVRPDAPRAHVVVISGGSGRLGIQDDGTMTTREARCGPVSRTRQALAEAGIGVALLDHSSTGGVGVPNDVAKVVDHVRAQAAVPVWVIGGSAGTEAAAVSAISLPDHLPIGVMLLSVAPISASLAQSIDRPAIVLVHASDSGSYGVAQTIYANLTTAPAKEFVTMTGGMAVADCLGPHSLDGLDAQIVERLTGLIDKYASAFVSGPPANALAVEYYNAGLDHYFLTHVADEIALLDAGTTIRGWSRTGQAFNVYGSAGAGTSPVCRFYIPPGKGDSHFYGRGTTECVATGAANPTFVNEDPQFFHVVLPVAGVCPAGTRNVYRVFSSRPDANHRYLVDPSIRDTMTARGWLAEGDGPNLVVMCTPA